MRKLIPFLTLLILTLCILPLYAHAAGGQIYGHAWQDTGDGKFREDARMTAGISVSLFRVEKDGSESRIGRQTTDSSGSYLFDGLGKGTYVLRADLPEGYTFILPGEGGSIMMPASGTSGFSLPLDLDTDQASLECNIGISRSATYIKVIAFEDANQNGGRSVAETLIRGVRIQLLYEMDGQLVQIAEAKTDMNGEAYFYRLTPGTYRIAATLPEPYIIGPLGDKTDIWHNCVPPQDSSYGISEPLKAPKGDSLGAGVSAVSSGTLKGTVWLDADRDGRKETAEGGYAGAMISLVSEEAGVSREITSGRDGGYRLDGLLAGDYMMTVTLPEEMMFTAAGDSLFDDGYTFSQSCIVTVEALAENVMPAIGVTDATSFSVSLYHDLNGNGIREEQETAFAGATLEVLLNDTVMAETMSDENGIAHIPVLREGEYDVHLVLPDGQVFSAAGPDNDFYALSATGNLTQPAVILPGTENTLSGGITLPASISGILFGDTDLNGIMDADESGLSGFTVQAVNADGVTVNEVLTDEEGRYTLSNLLPAPHTVRFVLEDAYVCTDYSQSGAPTENHVLTQTAAYGETASLSLVPGQQAEGISGGIFRSATVSGRVLLDSGVASLPDTGGLEGVLVRLLDEDGLSVSDTTCTHTDENGEFYLKGALPGVYRLEYVLPADAAFTMPETGEESVTSASFTLSAAQDLQVGSLSGVYTGTLTGTVYRDSNLNGTFDEGEEVFAGVPVQMENTELGQIYETVSLDNGQYIFDLLRPGEFTMRMTLPDGLCYCRDDSSPIAAQNGETAEACFTVGIGEKMLSRNVAAAAPASIQGIIYYDLENNGAADTDDPGAEGITLTLTGISSPVSYSLQTDAEGCFALDVMIPGKYMLRTTLPDRCIPADGNSAVLSEGFWESGLELAEDEQGETAYGILRYGSIAGHVWSLDGTLNGVEGRSVSLYAGDRTDPLAETVTDSTGAFLFSDLKPGMYRLTCDLPDDRYDYAREPDAVMRPSWLPGDEPDVPTGSYAAFRLPMGQDLSACDIGMGAMGALGDTAWLDLNGNGLQDGDEPMLPGIRIELYQYGEQAAVTETDSMGRYLAEGLYPGAYTVRVSVPPETMTTLHRTDYPLAASILPEGMTGIAEAEGVIVPSAGRNLNCDLGFVPLADGVYPASLDSLHQTDWSHSTAE